jgi:hypothetical protein
VPLGRAFAAIAYGPIRRLPLPLALLARLSVIATAATSAATITTKVASALYRTRLWLLAAGGMILVVMVLLVRVVVGLVTALAFFWL